MLSLPRKIAISMLFVVVAFACGKARVDSDPNWLDVNSKAQFGNQCPDGSWVDPLPADLEAVDCGLAIPKVTLSKPLDPLMISADCTKKFITIRSSQPGGLDSTWEVLPDNSFDFNIDGGKLTLTDDGRGHPDCLLPVAVNIFGKLNCANRDKITIDFTANWIAGKLDPASYSIIPFAKLHPDSGEVYCQVAPSCYLSAATKLNQCK